MCYFMCYSMLHQSNEIESNDIEPSQSKSNPTQPTDMTYCKCSKSEWAYHMHPCKPP